MTNALKAVFVEVFCYSIKFSPSKYLVTSDRLFKVGASKVKLCKAALFLN